MKKSELYLSRLELNLEHAPTLHAMADPYEMHRSLHRAFPDGSGRLLFRVETQRACPGVSVVLVQSEKEPDWKELPLEVRAMPPKPLPREYQIGRLLRFRLRANPTVKKRPEGSKNGYRVGVIGEDALRAWLERKARLGGFDLRALRVTEGSSVDCQRKGERMKFHSVLFDGVLEVLDPHRFGETLASGVGSAKGMGFGLLSLAPV